MNAIHKFELKHGLNKIIMSRECRVLCAKKQCNQLMLYVIVDPNDAAPMEYIFEVYATGEVLKQQFYDERIDWSEWKRSRENMKYIDTVVFDCDSSALHVFQNITGFGVVRID